MAWVYILAGSTGRYYIGSTTDLPRRLDQHQRGHTYTTRRLGIVELAASKEVETLAEARVLERKLKAKKNPQIALYLLRQI
ncbi:MAG: GIY-YIG nuclease family protein [Chthoniobacterales bacterium]